MAWIARELGAEILPVPVEESWQITGNLTGQDFPVCRFLPHKTCGEGLFLAVLRKEGSVEDDEVRFRTEGGKPERTKKGKQKGGKGAAPLAVPEEMKGWLQALADEAWDFRVEDDRCLAIPQQWSGLYDYLRSRLRILHAGVTLGELKGRDWQPHHSLAMSTRLNRGVFPEASLDYTQAVAYLRKQAVTLEPDVPRGYVLLTYQGHPLGFAKNIGNRANNLYPAEWRIRSGYLPEELRLVGWQ